MRQHHVAGARIAGVSCAVPQNEIFNTGVNERSGKAVGISSRRHAPEGLSFLDLAYRAAWECLRGVGWHASGPQALVVVTQSQPRRIPSIACELHHRLGMEADVPAFDVGLACSGYTYGLWIAAALRRPKTLLVVGDTISRFLDHSDAGTYPIFGDAVSATAIEWDNGSHGISFIGGTDGSGAESLRTERAYSVTQDRHEDVLHMQGQDVFDFALSTVPELVEETTLNAYTDWYLFHQANKTMISHIAKKSKLDPVKVPFNMDRYGNTSSASIPLLMCDSECTEALRTRKNIVSMFGFGAGYSYGGIRTEIDSIPLSVVSL